MDAMKSQVQVVQFVLFFIIGLSVFSSVYSFLVSHTNFVQDYMSTNYRELVSEFLSTATVEVVTSCKKCNVTSFKLSIPAKIVESNYEINLKNMYIRDLFYEKRTNINLHNLNYTYLLEDKNITVPSYPITFYFNKTENRIRILG